MFQQKMFLMEYLIVQNDKMIMTKLMRRIANVTIALVKNHLIET